MARSADRAHSLTLCPAAEAKDSSRANSSSISFVPTDRVRAAAPFLEVAGHCRKAPTENTTPFSRRRKTSCLEDALTSAKVPALQHSSAPNRSTPATWHCRKWSGTFAR